MSARELSFRINKNAGYISSVEAGKITPSVQTMFDICHELDINITSLFDLNTNKSTQYLKISEELNS